MKQLIQGLRRYGSDLIMIAGATAVAVGAGMICAPAGLIVGGGLAIAGAVLSSLGGGGDSA